MFTPIESLKQERDSYVRLITTLEARLVTMRARLKELDEALNDNPHD